MPRRAELGPAIRGGRLDGGGDLVVGAHPDDVELLGLVPIARSRRDLSHRVTAVVCTDGVPSTPQRAPAAAAAVAAERRAEQLAAARVARYRGLVLLDESSSAVRADPEVLVGALRGVVEAVRPDRVLTHDPTDPHRTHVAVAKAVVAAVATADVEGAMPEVLGVELGRSLSWLAADARVELDARGTARLQEELLAPFASQLAAKRYDRAAIGRHRANATFLDPLAPDGGDGVVLAMDLTSAARRERTLAELVSGHVERFRQAVVGWLQEPGGTTAPKLS